MMPALEVLLLAAFFFVGWLAALHREIGLDSPFHVREWHHIYLGVLLVILGQLWGPLAPLGLLLSMDDLYEHARETWTGEHYESPLHRLFGVLLWRFAWVRRLTAWLNALFLLFVLAVPLQGQDSGKVAIDTVAMRQLAAAWMRHPGDTLGCVAGHWEGAVPVLDSVPLLAMVCPVGTFGILGFVYGDPPEEAVLLAMRRVLDFRADVTLAGEVHAVIPVPLPDGRWVKGPLVYGVYRRSPTRSADPQGGLAMPATADSLWHAMLTCSGATVQPGGDLGDVHWRADADRLRAHHARAEWVPPDTILLSPDATAWEIAHELLHHLMRGPPDNAFTLGNKNHPMSPFYFPCRIMPRQNGVP